ncbi:hypothetical protein LWI29_021041 [Acer saccharum]|uniref:Uncharacterized protein n=1 Tax=Acer saccharum TaxID=4024 RepID=A0AA39T4P4_ACESA|nr:hypothetical protein LWI29_021041 [Acer saccharum]
MLELTQPTLSSSSSFQDNVLQPTSHKDRSSVSLDLLLLLHFDPSDRPRSLLSQPSPAAALLTHHLLPTTKGGGYTLRTESLIGGGGLPFSGRFGCMQMNKGQRVCVKKILVSKEEFQLALFKANKKESLKICMGELIVITSRLIN